MARADRLLRLIQVLRRHRTPVSAAALAEELEVSVRSV
jgi:predicted DNA-binding transcriptional regulator YafY